MKLKCHCGKRLADWTSPPGGDGGTLTLPCHRCGTDCPECHGLPSFTLHAAVRVVCSAPPGLRQLWDALWPRAS